MSETKKKVYPTWDDKANPVMPKKNWEVFVVNEGSGKSNVPPSLVPIGSVEAVDLAEAHGYADQRWGNQMYDRIEPRDPAGKPVKSKK